MTNTALDDQKQKPPVGLPRIMAGAIAGGISSWCLNWASLHGVDFKTFGVDSEYVKGAITGTLTGFFVAPDTFVFILRNFLIWCHDTAVMLWRAVRDGTE